MTDFIISQWNADDVAITFPYIEEYHLKNGLQLDENWQTKLQTEFDNRETSGSVWLKAETAEQELAGIMVLGKGALPLLQGNRLELWFFYVKPEFKKQGVSKALNKELENRAKEAGITQIYGLKTSQKKGITKKWRPQGTILSKSIE